MPGTDRPLPICLVFRVTENKIDHIHDLEPRENSIHKELNEFMKASQRKQHQTYNTAIESSIIHPSNACGFEGFLLHGDADYHDDEGEVVEPEGHLVDDFVEFAESQGAAGEVVVAGREGVDQDE